MNWHTIFGIASGLFLLLGNIPYILSIRHGKTIPNQVTWGIWTTIGFILLCSSYASGATNTLWLLVALVISESIITTYAFKYGRGKWQRLDRFCLGGAGVSLLLWQLSGSPLVAILMNTTMDMLGAVPTINKVYRNPNSEDLAFWSMSFISSLLNLLAIEQFSLSSVVFPLYLFSLNVIILLLITRPKWSQSSIYIRGKNQKKKNKIASNDFMIQIGGKPNKKKNKIASNDFI